MKIVLASVLILALCLASQPVYGTEDDDKWVMSVLVACVFLTQDMEDIITAANNMDFDGLCDGFIALYGHANAAEEESEKYSVSRELGYSKKEYEYALDDFKTAASYGYQGVDEMDSTKINLASIYIERGSEHLASATDALPQ